MIAINGNGNTDGMDWPGGIGNVQVAGTFDGATVTLECNMGPGWTAVGEATTFQEGGVAAFSLPACQLRLATAGGSSVELNAAIGGPRQSI